MTSSRSSSRKAKEPKVNAKSLTTTPPLEEATHDKMIDAVVHRVRNLNYKPRGILAMKSSPTSKYIAVARERGAVELVDPAQKFRIVASIAGLRERQIDVLGWIMPTSSSSTLTSRGTGVGSSLTEQIGVLFGGSRDGTLFHLDFDGMCHRSTINIGGGAILAMQPITFSSEKGTKMKRRRLVAVACEDGTVRILEYTEPENTIIQVASLSMGGNLASPVLSLAWNESKQVLIGGVADGTIRRFDCTNVERQSYRPSKVRITVENYGRRTPTRIWSLLLLDDLTVVSGDSLGHVQFWDGNLGTLLQSYDQNPERADVLTLCMDRKQGKVFASGIDSRVVCFKKQDHRWITTTAQRPHTHDVKTLCIYSKRKHGGGSTEFLASGGTDTKICTYIVDSFKGNRPKKYFPWPSTSPIHLAKKGRVLAMMREHSIDLYNVKCRNDVDDMFSAQPGQPRIEKNYKLGSIDIDSSYNLVCSTISNTANLLAVSDGAGVMLFSLTFSLEGRKKLTTASPVILPANAKAPCSALRFSDDGKMLVCASIEDSILILSVNSSKSEENNVETELLHTFDANFDCTVPATQLALSPDGNWLAAGRNVLGTGAVHVFAIDRNPEISFKHWWSIPEFEAPQSCIRFWEDPDVEPTLVVGCANNAFYMFDVRERSLSEWSQDAGIPIQKKIPQELVNQVDYPVRLAFNPSSPSKFVLVRYIISCVSCKLEVQLSPFVVEIHFLHLFSLLQKCVISPVYVNFNI